MMTRTIRIWLLAVCALALGYGMARASVGAQWSDNDLERFSAAIVIGRVSDVATGRDARTGAIHTYVTVVVDQAVKGDIPERTIIVKQLGGTLGDEHLEITG